MFMCTKEEEAKTKIKLSLLEHIVLKQEQGESAPTSLEVIPLALPSAGPARDPTATPTEARAGPKSLNETSVSHLFAAIDEGRIGDVRHALDYVALRCRDPRDGRTPLMAAVGCAGPATRRLRLLRLLLSRGAALTPSDPVLGRDAIGWAAAAGREAELDLLLDARAGEVDFGRTDRRGATYLHLAVTSGRLEVVETLLSRMRPLGLPLDVPDRLGLTPYLYARRLGLHDIASALRADGRASEGRRDDLMFRGPREWSILGRRERRGRPARLRAPLITVSAPDLRRLEALPPPSPLAEVGPGHGKSARGTLHRCLALWSEQQLPTFRRAAQRPSEAEPGHGGRHERRHHAARPHQARRVRLR